MSYRKLVLLLAFLLIVPIAIFLVYAFAQGWFFRRYGPNAGIASYFCGNCAIHRYGVGLNKAWSSRQA